MEDSVTEKDFRKYKLLHHIIQNENWEMGSDKVIPNMQIFEGSFFFLSLVIRGSGGQRMRPQVF